MYYKNNEKKYIIHLHKLVYIFDEAVINKLNVF